MGMVKNMTMCNFRKYFNGRKAAGAVTLLIFGILLFVMGLSVDSGFVWTVIGGVMSAGGIVMIVKFNKNQSDSAVDAFCRERVEEYYNNKRSIVDSRGVRITDTICTNRYCFENIFNARKAIRGKDHIWRSSVFEMSCIFFSEEMILYFTQKVSLITDEKSEKQKEFRLLDIQMVSLEETDRSIGVVITIPGNEKIYVSCKNKEGALELRDRIRSKIFKRESP